MRRTLCGVLVFLVARSAAPATSVPSSSGEPWDVQDTSPWAQDSGGIATGGPSLPFNGFGYLKVRVLSPRGDVLVPTRYLHGFGLHYDGDARFDSVTPVMAGDVAIARSLFARKDADYLRYFDALTSFAREERVVEVAWGGACGAYEDGGRVRVAATANGNLTLEPQDASVTVMQGGASTQDPRKGPSTYGPSAHVLGTAGGILSRFGDMYADPFTDAYPGFDPAHIAYVFRLTLRPGETRALVTFVVKGRAEGFDPRGGIPVPLKDTLVTRYFPPPFPEPKLLPAGSQIAYVGDVARKLVATPDLVGLTARERAAIANWPGQAPVGAFSVLEASVASLRGALETGLVTSEDLVRAYLARIAAYDRSGPELRAILTLNPKAFAVARERDRERAAGRLRGPFHGVPVAFKDNIDATDLPTTGGSRALATRVPRVDSAMVARMRAAGAIVLGKTNLDEFPFGDFGVSTLGGRIGNAFDPTLGTAGSSGGSAVAVSANLVTIAFGTDTCNSLSNPSGFASLATIRTTRGLTSRAGVMPLIPWNDAVGPMARSVADLAAVLDVVAGPDPDDPATATVEKRPPGAFVKGLDANALAGARLGLLRQRFVNITQEREAAEQIDAAARDLKAKGATVVDVALPGFDALYKDNVLRDPGALVGAWDAYLSRGAQPGEKSLTVKDLLATGLLAPESASTFKNAVEALSTRPADLESRFRAGREAFRDALVRLLDRERLDALVYPANHARPSTHEGGEIRYGFEPGTCEESATTGLPQVTVPAGFMGGRYPVGVSLLGRLGSDGRLLALAYAYEQATRHHRPSPVAP